MSLFSEKIHQDDKKETDHFENIQSTNWQTMRFKVFFPSLISEFGIGISWTDFFFSSLQPPPPNSPIGWRVEFRPCELQFTDFENAAVVCFVVLITRVILSFGYGKNDQRTPFLYSNFV